MKSRGHRPTAAASPARASEAGTIDERRRRYQAACAASRFDEALRLARELVECSPDDAEHHAAEGRALLGLERWAEAETSLERAVAIEPAAAVPWFNLGVARERSFRFDRAIEAFRAAVERDPADASFAVALAWCLAETAAGEEAIEVLRRQALAGGPDLEVMRLVAYVANLLPGRTAASIAALHRSHGLALEAAVRPIAADRRLGGPFRAPRRGPDEPLRVGFLGGDFREHSVGRFFLPVLRAFDRRRIRPFLYMLSARRDERSAAFEAEVGADWVAAHGLDAVSLVARARRDGLDAMVDLQGLTADARLGEFCCRMAMVQATWLGYSNSTGVPGIDLRIVDDRTDPGESSDQASERLVRIAAPFLRWIAEDPVARRAEGRPFTFGSFGATARLNAETVGLWGRAVAAVPGSRLLLKSAGLGEPSARGRVLAWLGAAGLPGDRVELRGRTERVADHVAMHGELDIALDTFPAHGTTTTVEALSHGVPVVTMAGDRHAARVGVSLLHAVGLDDLVARDAGDFVEKAVRLANDRARLDALRGQLPARIADGPLGDARGLADELVQVLHAAVHTAAHGRGEAR